MINLLCRLLGLCPHKWGKWEHFITQQIHDDYNPDYPLGLRKTQKRTCERCGKAQTNVYMRTGEA